MFVSPCKVFTYKNSAFRNLVLVRLHHDDFRLVGKIIASAEAMYFSDMRVSNRGVSHGRVCGRKVLWRNFFVTASGGGLREFVK